MLDSAGRRIQGYFQPHSRYETHFVSAPWNPITSHSVNHRLSLRVGKGQKRERESTAASATTRSPCPGRRFHPSPFTASLPTIHTPLTPTIHYPSPRTRLSTTMSPTTVLKRPQAPSASALLASPKTVKNSKPLANSSVASLTYGCGRSPISSLVH